MGGTQKYGSQILWVSDFFPRVNKMDAVVWTNHGAAVAAVVLLASYGRTVPLLCATLFLGSTTAWLHSPTAWLHSLQLPSVVTGSALLCATVAITTGRYTRLASVKMMAAVLTQGSACSVDLFGIPWPFAPAPTDATLLNAVVALVFVGWVCRSQSPALTRVAPVHALLATATLVLRLGAPPVAYTFSTWCAVLATGIVKESEGAQTFA